MDDDSKRFADLYAGTRAVRSAVRTSGLESANNTALFPMRTKPYSI